MKTVKIFLTVHNTRRFCLKLNFLASYVYKLKCDLFSKPCMLQITSDNEIKWSVSKRLFPADHKFPA